MNGIGLP